MKQVLRKGFKHIVVDEVPDPVVTPHHVLIRPHYSLISSGTETASIHPDLLKVVKDNPSHLQTVLNVAKVEGPLHTFDELRAKFSAYAVLGYSGAGVVAEKHSTVKDLEIGDFVAYGGEGTGHGESILTGRNLIARVPEGLPFEQATFATLGSIALNAVRTANLGLGDVVAVMGLGLVGQLVAQLARMQGAVVIGLDLRPERVKLALELGADAGIAGADSTEEAVLAKTNGRGADCVIIAAAAKSPVPAQQALKICRDRGKIVVVGAVEINLPWLNMYLKEIQLLMSRAYGPGSYDPAYEGRGQDYPISYVRWTENRNMEEFLRAVAAGRVQVKPLITHEYPLDRAPEAYSAIMSGGSSLAVVLRYPEADLTVPSDGAAIHRKIETPGIAAPAGQIQLAVAGAGGIARWAHLPALKKIPNVAVRAIYSSSGARGKTYALRYKAKYCTTDYAEILKDPELNLVLVVSRNQQHASQSVAALRAGKNVFVEKPMALTVEECRELAEAVKESGKALTVGFNRRFAPDYLRVKERVVRRVGPAVINCRVNSPGISGSYWMADPAAGGAILGEACHFVDLMYWLLESEPVEVHAYSLPQGGKEPIGENNMAASFRFADGSVGNLTYSTVGSKASAGERVEVFGQGFGADTQNFTESRVHGASTARSTSMLPRKGYDAQMSSFLESLMHGTPLAVDVRDGARATLGCLKMLESAKIGQPCAIDLAEALAPAG
ncbi:MAG: bi-domain-containing oxidoreductase [Acidobacteriota bacterium]|nr:bi-domain-containing oxidoreductase [Acidobacteriota bacterium]